MTHDAILLHGLGGGPSAWDRLRPLIEAPHVAAPALRSGRTIVADADHVAATGAADRPDSRAVAAVVGHSRGGLVAVALAEQHPDLVSRLVLVNTPPTTDSRLTARSGGERILAVPFLGRLAWLAMTPAVAARGLETAFATGTEVPNPFVDDLRRTGRASFVAASRGIDAYLDELDLLARLTRLDLPVDVVLGTQDRRVDLTPYDAAADLPHVTVHRIRDAGHTPIWETPAEVARVISRADTETDRETTP